VLERPYTQFLSDPPDDPASNHKSESNKYIYKKQQIKKMDVIKKNLTIRLT
jgi:hypothetical protein